MKLEILSLFGRLLKAAYQRYDAAMSKIIRHGDKEVMVFTTPDGVTGIVDTAIPAKALDAMAAKLEMRLRAMSKRPVSLMPIRPVVKSVKP